MSGHHHPSWDARLAADSVLAAQLEQLDRAFTPPAIRPPHPIEKIYGWLGDAAARGERVLIVDGDTARLYNPEAAAQTDEALSLAPTTTLDDGRIAA